MLSTLADVEELLDTLDPATAVGGEAQLGDTNRQLLDAEAVVDEALQRDPDQTRALILSAVLATRMQRWDVAVVRWNRVLAAVPSSRQRAHHNLAIAYRGLGSFTRARGALSKLKSGVLPGKQLRIERRRLAQAETGWAGTLIANRAVDSLVQGDPDGVSDHLIETVLSLRDAPDEEGACVRAVHTRALEVLSEPGEPSDEPTAPAPGTGPHPVFFCGFGWSGSGALFDYFRQSPRSSTPFGKVELMAFERGASIKRLRRAVDLDEDAFRRELVHLVFHATLAVGGPPTSTAAAVRAQSIIEYVAPGHLTSLADACDRLLTSSLQARSAGDVDRLERAIRSFVARVLTLTAPEDSVALMSNCITAANIGIVELIGDAKAFAVFRDPRDQYVAQRYEYKNRHRLSTEAFIRKVRSRTRRYHDAVTAAPPGRIEAVQFEEFVLSADVRASLADRVGIPLDSLPGDLAYHPTDSTPNVGIHRTYPDTDEIRHIEEELSDLLHDAV